MHKQWILGYTFLGVCVLGTKPVPPLPFLNHDVSLTYCYSIDCAHNILGPVTCTKCYVSKSAKNCVLPMLKVCISAIHFVMLMTAEERTVMSHANMNTILRETAHQNSALRAIQHWPHKWRQYETIS